VEIRWLTSRGFTIPKLPETEIKENDSVTPAVIPNVSGDAVTSLTHKILGGYDGGVEVGFNGECVKQNCSIGSAYFDTVTLN